MKLHVPAVIAPACALILCVCPVAADPGRQDGRPATRPATQPAVEGFALTVYSTAEPDYPWEDLDERLRYRGETLPGYAVVREVRGVEIAQGASELRFEDVPSGIDPTTTKFASLTEPRTRVLEQNYEFDLVSFEVLLRKYVGGDVTLRRDGEARQVRVLSVDDGTLLYQELADGEPAGPVRAMSGSADAAESYVTAIELPDTQGLIVHPTLVWDIVSPLAGRQMAEVSYQTTGLAWHADYTFVVHPGDDALDASAWVSLYNRSGMSFPEASLKLVAGDVQRVNPPGRRYGGGGGGFGGGAGYAQDQPQFVESGLFEYHLYTLSRPTDIGNNTTKQIELFAEVPGVPAEKVFVYYGLPLTREYLFFPNVRTDRDLGLKSNNKVDTYLRFRNAKEHGMGMPLPAGRIRVYKRDAADGSLQFVGEDVIDHTPREEEVLVKLGSAFDIVGERRTVNYEQGHEDNAADKNEFFVREEFEIRLRNRKTEPVTVLVKENLYRWSNWEIVEASHAFEKQDARTIHFPVTVGPDEEVAVTYTVRYTW
jgi:hypothetical protein